MLLSLARSIFEEQNNLDCLVSKIMTQARDLIKCERCVVFLLDLECEEAVRVFWQRYFPIYIYICICSCIQFLFFIEPFGTLWSQASKLFVGKKSIYEKCNKITKIITIKYTANKSG